MLGEDLTVEVEETGFDNRGNGAWINLTEGVIFAHVTRDTPRVKGQICHVMIAVYKTSRETIRSVDIIRVQGCCYFEPRSFIIDIVTGIIMDGNNRKGTIAIQTRIKFTQKIDLIT